MLSVVIVDDEPIIRLGVKASIQWRELGLAFAGEYSNGADALRALEREPADIVITDIKMPVMGGLELTERVRSLRPSAKVILISSYNDFEYAKKGIVLGASDYILKPTMEPEELNEVLGRCAEEIRREREIGRRLDGYESGVRERERRGLEQEAKKLFTQERDGEEIGEGIGEEFAARFPEGCVLARAALNEAEAIRQKNGPLYVGILLDEWKDRFYAVHERGIAFAAGEEELVMLIPRPEANPPRLMEELTRGQEADLTLGYAEAEEPGEWRSRYRWTEQIYGRRFFDGPGGPYLCQPKPDADADAGAGVGTGVEAAVASSMEPYGPLRERLKRWEKYRYDAGRVKREACDLFSRMFVRRMEPALLLEYYRQFMGAETLADLARALESAIREGEAQRQDEERAQPNTGIVAKAMDFIHEKYAQEITLQTVADHVHVSKNYFSVLFKKRTNQNFIDYLIQLRIEKAKSLLPDKSLKIYEVAEQAGFNDVKYFSKLFKKVVGSTPAEYRERLV